MLWTQADIAWVVAGGSDLLDGRPLASDEVASRQAAVRAAEAHGQTQTTYFLLFGQ